ncbi:LuxR C-terminal-related transcriptional regulator [Streptomyces sp. I6]|uniref:LuxR C-terminal-related transcriptional regulator n=1 Tax=Streptomyces sp. I6 TaxID=2483113 RepID=UPI0028804C17|nr:LuxR C-terminal-related transcriptional regulator [Streptomyces sp. I6]
MRGREKQLAQTGAQLRRVARGGRSAVLLVEAAPGAGKTRLLAEAAKLADADGFVVVGGVPAGSDAAIEAARTRLRHAGRARTVVVLDDLHLASLPALTALCDLVVALKGLPILWLIALSTDRGDALHEPLKDCLGTLRAGLPVEDVRELGPIEGEALVHLVADCTGAAPDPALLALAESVNDTPRAVIELMRGLADDDLCVVDGTSRLQLGPPGAALLGGGVPAPVPKRFSALIQQDLRSLSEPTLKALRLAAVLGSPFAPEDLSALLGEAPVGLLTAVDEAVDRGLLVCGEHDLAFRTEPIWRVLLDSVPQPVCALLRRQAAKMLLPRPGGVERAALQLIHVAQPGNAEEIRVISDGARKLLVADPSTAASLATRCMELLAPGQAERLRLARTAVEACTKAGHLERAITLARAAIDDAAPLAPPLPAEFAEDVAALKASMSTALLLLGNVQSARRAAGDALAARRAGDQHREAVIAHLAASYLTGDGTSMDRAQQILDAPDRHTRAVVAGAMTFRAFGQWREGEVGEAVSTLREAVALDRTSEEGQMLDPRWFLAFALTRTDEYEQAAAVIRSSAETSAPETAALTTAVPAVLRAQLHLAQGRLDEAEAEARTGVGTGGRHIPMLAPQAWLVLASVALRRGTLTQAEDHVRALKKDFPQHASSPWWAARLLMNARLAEAQAGPLAAAEVLAEIGAQAGSLREAVLEDPAAAAWCVRSMLAADRPDLVEMVIGTTQDVLVRNPRLPSVLATAMHARALAEADPKALARAGRLHRNPWAQAAAAEDHAALLLDRGDHENAISELDRAMSAYGALGGERDAARVRARLRGLGVRRRHWKHAKRPVSGWESLTKTERKVAELVAGGLTNQQAARHLFISPHTVGFHLRQIYRKLGIRSRTALIRLRA